MLGKRTAPAIAVTCILSAWSAPASALDPALDVSQYGHVAWKNREALFKGRIDALAQPADGYVWVGTEFGLFRFDGVRGVPWQPPAGSSLPDSHIRALLATRDGTLWIGTWAGLASWKGGRLIVYPRLNGSYINALIEDSEGTVWVGAAAPGTGLLCTIRGGTTECHGDDGSLGSVIGSLYEDDSGVLWVGGLDRVWRWKPGTRKVYSLPGRLSGLQALSEASNGAILVATLNGIQQIVGDKIEPLALPAMPRGLSAPAILRDRDGGLWIGTYGAGLLHVHDGRMDAFAQADGLSSQFASRLFEDREGNVWVMTTAGLDRFRALGAATYSAGQGLPLAASVLGARDGSVWVSIGSGLKRYREGRFVEADPRPPAERKWGSLFEDRHGRIWVGSASGFGYVENGTYVRIDGVRGGYIDSLAEDQHGNLWIAHREAGLLRLSPEHLVEQIPWTKIGGGQPALRLAVDPVAGGLWLGYADGGLVHLQDGRIAASFPAQAGASRRVNQISVSPDGAVWVASEQGLRRIKGSRTATLDRRSGLPCDTVLSTIADDTGSIWLYTECGLVRIARSELDAWAAAADNGGAPREVHGTVLDSSDGVANIAAIGSYAPHAARSLDGKLWFVTDDGVMMIDPRNLRPNKLPPPVHVESLVADRKTYEASRQISLPPLVRDLQIDYTALSFVAPEKNRFRYKLEGRDSDWQDAGNRRQAFYADLDPGHYRFRVIASNNSGVWNEQGATLEFSVAPAYWQTNWFRALCVAAFVALSWVLYRLRVHQLARQFNRTLEARVNERTRIARDLHDTLLQSFHGLLLRFQTARDLFGSRPADALKVLDDAIDLAADAITEGRDAVQGLRSSSEESNDLADAIQALGGALSPAAGADAGPALRIDVQGEPRELHPIVRDELMRIAGEAMRNAFRHAAAKHVEVEIHYGDRRMRVRVRDDGKGIAAETLQAGAREGHFGLPGMRERARVVGGKLTVWTGLGTGTEIDVSVPAAHAYASFAPTTGWRAWIGSVLHPRAEAIDS